VVEELAARTGANILGVLTVASPVSVKAREKAARWGRDIEDNAAWVPTGKRRGYLALGLNHTADVIERCVAHLR
jgi:hypothetical protein